MGVLLLLELSWFCTTQGRIRLRVGWRGLADIFRQSWPLGLGETLNRVALHYPVILIGAMIGSEGAGNFRIAELAYAFLAQFGHMLATAGFSRLAHLFHHGRSQLAPAVGKLLASTVGGAAGAGLLLMVLGPNLFEIVLGGITAETAGVIRVLGAALVFSAPARLLRALLASIDRQASLLPVTTLGILVGVGVGWSLAPRYGIVGIAAGVLVAELVSLLILAAVFAVSLRAGDRRSSQPGRPEGAPAQPQEGPDRQDDREVDQRA
jgi:O-antigen/teichoic acid export membrane protein